MIEQPDGIIITVSAGMIGKNGYRHWLRNFLYAMAKENYTYHFRQGNQPKKDVLYIYLCIGNAIRFRINYVQSVGPSDCLFDGHDELMSGKAWVIGTGPLVRAPHKIKKQGFQGFRYTKKIF